MRFRIQWSLWLSIFLVLIRILFVILFTLRRISQLNIWTEWSLRTRICSKSWNIFIWILSYSNWRNGLSLSVQEWWFFWVLSNWNLLNILWLFSRINDRCLILSGLFILNNSLNWNFLDFSYCGSCYNRSLYWLILRRLNNGWLNNCLSGNVLNSSWW